MKGLFVINVFAEGAFQNAGLIIVSLEVFAIKIF